MESPDVGPQDSLPLPLQERLLQTRTVLIYGELNHVLAQSASQQLLALASLSPEPLSILINARGDDFSAGLALYDLIQSLPPRAVTLASGSVGGAAVLAYLAPDRVNRLCLPNARFLLHQPSLTLSGDSEDLASGSEAALELRLHACQVIAWQTGQPLGKVKLDSSRDFWLAAQEALEYGLVGKIIHSIHEAGTTTYDRGHG